MFEPLHPLPMEAVCMGEKESQQRAKERQEGNLSLQVPAKGRQNSSAGLQKAGEAGQLGWGARAAGEWLRAWIQLCLALLCDLGLSILFSGSQSSSHPTLGPVN